MEELVLTVQPHGEKKYRLGVNTKDSREKFKRRNRLICMIIENIKIKVKTTCGLPNFDDEHNDSRRKKGYDIYHIEIDKWIKLNQFNCYEKGKPTKLKFQLIKVNECIELKYIEKLSI